MSQYKLVPLEPTPEMEQAGWAANISENGEPCSAVLAYKAMIETAPEECSPSVGRDFGTHVCNALGLDPKKVRSLSINASHDALTVAVVEILIPSRIALNLTEMLKRYRIVKSDADEAA